MLTPPWRTLAATVAPASLQMRPVAREGLDRGGAQPVGEGAINVGGTIDGQRQERHYKGPGSSESKESGPSLRCCWPAGGGADRARQRDKRRTNWTASAFQRPATSMASTPRCHVLSWHMVNVGWPHAFLGQLHTQITGLLRAYVQPSVCFGLVLVPPSRHVQRVNVRVFRCGRCLLMWTWGAAAAATEGQLGRLLSLPYTCLAARIARDTYAEQTSNLLDLELLHCTNYWSAMLDGRPGRISTGSFTGMLVPWLPDSRVWRGVESMTFWTGGLRVAKV
eukprot:s274_g5.t1